MLSDYHDQGTVLGARATTTIKTNKNPFSCLGTIGIIQKRGMTHQCRRELTLCEGTEKRESRGTSGTIREKVPQRSERCGDNMVGACGPLFWPCLFCQWYRKKTYQLSGRKREGLWKIWGNKKGNEIYWQNRQGHVARLWGRTKGPVEVSSHESELGQSACCVFLQLYSTAQAQAESRQKVRFNQNWGFARQTQYKEVEAILTRE